MVIGSIAAFAVFLTAGSSGGAVVSDKERDKVRSTCISDVMRLCPREASARDRAGVRACLKANFAKTSLACQSSLQAVAAERGSRTGQKPLPARPAAPTRSTASPQSPKS